MLTINKIGIILAWLLIAKAIAQMPESQENQAIEFDDSLLQKIGGMAVDTSLFRYGNPIPTGEHLVDVFVNGRWQGETMVRFHQTTKQPIDGLCMDEKWLQLLNVRLEAITTIKPIDNDCIPAVKALPKLDFAFDPATWRLDITVPKNLILKPNSNHVSPSDWQNGITTAFVRYRLNHQQHTHHHALKQYGNLAVNTGINWNGWALRHRGLQSWQNHRLLPYQYHSTYASHDIDMLNGRLTLGDFYTTNANHNIALRGVLFATDKRMNQKNANHNPIIHGLANSNAKVRIYQDGQIIYETTVVAGAFTLDDVRPLTGFGHLKVEILEESGEVQHLTIPYARSSQLMQTGDTNLQMAMGLHRNQDKVSTTPVFWHTLQHGISNTLTVRSNGTLSKDYQQLSLGGVWASAFGLIENDWSLYLNKQYKQGDVRLTLSKNIAHTDTNLHLGLYHAFLNKKHHLQKISIPPTKEDDNIQNRYSLALRQSLGDKYGYLQLNAYGNRPYEKKDFWHEYQLSYGNTYKGLKYQAGISKSYHDNQSNNRFYLSLSMPLDNRQSTNKNNTRLSTLYQQSQQEGKQTRLALSGNFKSDNPFGYHINATQYDNKDNIYSINTYYHTPFVHLNARLNKQHQHTQWSALATGALVAHPYGLTATSTLGDTFGVVRAKNAHGALIHGTSHGRIDRFGNAIVPYLRPYQQNNISINPKDLSDDTEVKSINLKTVPRANTSSLLEFQTTFGQWILLEIQSQNNITPPLGTAVYNDKGQTVGYIVQGGRAFVRGINQKERLTITWGNSQSERCHINYDSSNQKTQDNTPTIAVDCLP